jgi:hypothetical protein
MAIFSCGTLTPDIIGGVGFVPGMAGLATGGVETRDICGPP